MRLAAALASLCLAFAPLAAAAKTPVVIELFTSQGCAACAPASELVSDLARRTDVLPLTFSVDAWDYLGWRDTFARPEFAERQRAYARLAGRAVFTPQVVVNGKAQAAALEDEDVARLILAARRTPGSPPQMRFMGPARVAIGAGAPPRGGAEVWLVRYDPRGLEVEIRRGENRGRTIVYRNVVRELVRLGDWRGRRAAFDLPAAKEEGLETVVLVQQAGGGRVLAVGRD